MELLLTRNLPQVAAGDPATLTVTDVYQQHADFVWRSLQHLGIGASDLEDITQEVFVVVHRKLSTFNGSSQITTWLFGICLRVADRHRRRAYFRFEQRTPDPPERVDKNTPEDGAAERERQQLLAVALEKLSLAQRAVFVLFEIEGHSCAEIAELLAVPVGTVHSRLHAARKEVLRALSRANARLRQGDMP